MLKNFCKGENQIASAAPMSPTADATVPELAEADALDASAWCVSGVCSCGGNGDGGTAVPYPVTAAVELADAGVLEASAW